MKNESLTCVICEIDLVMGDGIVRLTKTENPDSGNLCVDCWEVLGKYVESY